MLRAALRHSSVRQRNLRNAPDPVRAVKGIRPQRSAYVEVIYANSGPHCIKLFP